MSKTRRDVDNEIANKAAKDAKFRAKLIKDPKGVLADMGLMVRDGHSVAVVEESATQKYIVLPPAQASASGDLDDDALEAVAAGQFTATCYSCGAG